MEDYIKYEIPSFNIQFEYPDLWESKIEDDSTYLFWDEYVGSFRITPRIVDSLNFSIDQYLQSRFQEYSNKNPSWRNFNGNEYLCFEDFSKDNNGETKLHFFISGKENVLITCSFAYNKKLLEDEYSKNEVEHALEDVEQILSSLFN